MEVWLLLVTSSSTNLLATFKLYNFELPAGEQRVLFSTVFAFPDPGSNDPIPLDAERHRSEGNETPVLCISIHSPQYRNSTKVAHQTIEKYNVDAYRDL